LKDSLRVVKPDITRERLNRADIEKHNRDMGRHQVFGQSRFELGGHHRNTPHFVLNDLAHRRLGAAGLVVGIAQQKVESVLQGGGLEALNDFGKKRVTDIGDNEAKKIAPAAHQATRVDVLVETELSNDLLDLPLGFGGYGT